MESPIRRGRALAFGTLLALGTGAVWAVLSAVFDLHLGLLVVAAFGGWLIGSAVKPIGKGARRWAIGLALLATVIGSVGDFVLSQALLPEASTPLLQRVSLGSYLDYLAGTFDPIVALAVVVLVILAWRSAR
jgi:hypothetical protein